MHSISQTLYLSYNHTVTHKDNVPLMIQYASLTYTPSAMLKLHSVTVSRERSLQEERYLVIVLLQKTSACSASSDSVFLM